MTNKSHRGNKPHAHCWIDPSEAPINRAPYSPVVGDGPRQMKPGKTYLCRECGAECAVPEKRAAFRATEGS